MKPLTLKHLGAYGLLIEDDKILLIKKVGGPYTGLLDLPGGTIEFNEKPEETLIREWREEVKIDVTSYEFYNADIANVEWEYNGEIQKIQHIGFFYKIKAYTGDIQNDVVIDESNNDSLGAEFYKIQDLAENELSAIALLQLKKLGYFNTNKEKKK